MPTQPMIVGNPVLVVVDIQEGGGDEHVFGEVGIPIMDGGEGNNTIIGGSGKDVIHAGDGNNWINGRRGDDTERERDRCVHDAVECGPALPARPASRGSALARNGLCREQ